MENRHQQALDMSDWKNWKWDTYSDIESNKEKLQLIAAVVQRALCWFFKLFQNVKEHGFLNGFLKMPLIPFPQEA